MDLILHHLHSLHVGNSYNTKLPFAIPLVNCSQKHRTKVGLWCCYIPIFQIVQVRTCPLSDLELFLNLTMFPSSTKASLRGCNMNLKRVTTLTPCSPCFSPPPTEHKQAPGSLIGQGGRRWQYSLSSPVVTDGAPPWFPQWSAPLVHLERGHSRTGATHKRTTVARRTCTNVYTGLDKQSV